MWQRVYTSGKSKRQKSNTVSYFNQHFKNKFYTDLKTLDQVLKVYITYKQMNKSKNRILQANTCSQNSVFHQQECL